MGMSPLFKDGSLAGMFVVAACCASGAGAGQPAGEGAPAREPARGPTTAASSSPIDAPAARDAVLRALSGSDVYRKAAARQADQRLVTAQVVRYGKADGQPAVAAAQPAEVVEILQFKYDGGTTIRSVVDARDNKVLKVEELKAYPTPLAPEEESEARKLAAGVGPAKQLIDALGADALKERYLAPVVSNPDDPKYGHRLAVVWFIPKDKKGGRSGLAVDVDLTTKTATARQR